MLGSWFWTSETGRIDGFAVPKKKRKKGRKNIISKIIKLQELVNNEMQRENAEYSSYNV